MIQNHQQATASRATELREVQPSLSTQRRSTARHRMGGALSGLDLENTELSANLYVDNL